MPYDEEDARHDRQMSAIWGAQAYERAEDGKEITEQLQREMKALKEMLDKSEKTNDVFIFTTQIINSLWLASQKLEELGFIEQENVISARNLLSDTIHDILGDLIGGAENKIEHDISENQHYVRE